MDKDLENTKVVLDVVCGKWKAVILLKLFDGTLRFGEIKKSIPLINHQTLIKQLRELEEDHLISKKSYPVVPPWVEYSLTKYGRSLKPLLNEMVAWGEKHNNKDKTPS
ncbi:winged helix-turn-helix transcriptional regulator [Gracilibacillus kekensis]|uniref:Transcriptional regulator, HxlR family n=1 Tax=Gracilibacillus kekensis TaxID=1027249 RepID=A0A1M7L1P3_9BACI|nr:helix-turn-helix domain-containing protein [Gracilibacillus kekensis]SHM71817.1 transcriptional regulator, HxlR family [Gracilibacillus kekensis]